MKLKERVSAMKVKNSNGLLGAVLKGVLCAVCVSLALVLVFAFLLKFTNIPESVIKPINQVIKGVSVFVGVFVGMKKLKELGLVSGLLIGLAYTIMAFLIFSILGGSFNFDLTFLTDIVFGGVIGSICGIICVNLKKSNN